MKIINNFVIYYGDFDPPTSYDIDVVTKLASTYKNVIIIPLNGNYNLTSYPLRYNLCKAMLESIKDNIRIENYILNNKKYQNDEDVIKSIIFRIDNYYKNNSPITLVGYNNKVINVGYAKYIPTSSILDKKFNPIEFKKLYNEGNKECFAYIPAKYINFVNSNYGNKIIYDDNDSDEYVIAL